VARQRSPCYAAQSSQARVTSRLQSIYEKRGLLNRELSRADDVARRKVKMQRVIACTALLALTVLFFPWLSVAAEVASIQVRGKSIKVGDTADYVFSVLKKDEMLKQDVGPDPKNPNSLALTKYYTADGKSFALSFSRQRDPGPYVVTKIFITKQPVAK
jgi:hypothetical protein